MSDLYRECEHGRLRRKCELCELSDEIARLTMAVETERGHREADKHEASEEIERLTRERDEARDAARELAEYRPVMAEDRRSWVERFPWLEEREGEG